MRIRILAFCLAGLLPTPSLADMLPGADDPRFIAAMTLALATDAPRTLTDLHTLATAGNIAALVALPTVERWLPRTGPLSERAKLRKINGTPVTDLADAASPISRLWRQGIASDDMAEQIDRATGLFALGETAMGDALLAVWFNYTGGFSALPAGFADLPASPWIKAGIIEARLNPFLGNPAPDPDGNLAILTNWLADNRLEGWIVLARMTGHANRLPRSIELTIFGNDLLTTALAAIPPDVAATANVRMAAAALVWQANWAHLPDPSLSDAAVQTIWQNLSPRVEFAPVVLYCTARCPADPAQCEQAYLQAFGYNNGNLIWFAPQQDAISQTTFYASPRGEWVLMSTGLTHGLHMAPETLRDTAAINAAPAVAAARKTDACFASGLDRVLAGPLPVRR